jgi:patatin-like phospholipase/acyl hydrolase
MIAAGLTIPTNPTDERDAWIPKYSAADLIKILEKNASKMFEKDWTSLGGLLGPRYRTSSLQSVMNHLFGDTTFDKSLTFTMITSYDLNAQEPKFFKSWEEKEIFRTQDVAVATGSAPTYFAPYSIVPVKGSIPPVSYKLIDGAMVVNSSVECLLIEAKKIFPHARKFEIVSLGTGKYQLPLDYSPLRTAGLLTWARRAPAIMLSSQPTVIDYVMKQNLGDCYSRWNPTIVYGKHTLDDIKKEQLD